MPETLKPTPTPVADGAAGTVEMRPRRRLVGGSVDFALRYGMIWGFIALAIAAQILYPGFFDWGNIRNMLSQNAPVGIVAVGMTFVIIAGGFDLSVPAIFAVAGIVFAKFAGEMPIVPAGLLALGTGLVAGAINGVIVTRLEVNPFITTLGTASVFGGLAFIICSSQPVVVEKAGFNFLGTEKVAGIPVSVIVLVAIFLIGGFVLARTVYGRSVYAVGGNAEASRLAGMRVDLVKFSTYLLTGAGAALAGMIIASQTGVAQPETETNLALDSIAIVIIGGTSLLGGEGAMWRTLIGMLILATLNNLFDAMALETSAQLLVKGAIVIGAVALDAYARRRQSA